MIPILTFVTVVVVSFAVYEWVGRARVRYLVMRHERTGDIPPLGDPSVAQEFYSKPWRWPFRAGAVWRAQTKWDHVRHSDPDLDAAQRLLERRQRIAVVVYLVGLASFLLSPLVRV
jgi:hypothetical protein